MCLSAERWGHSSLGVSAAVAVAIDPILSRAFGKRLEFTRVSRCMDVSGGNSSRTPLSWVCGSLMWAALIWYVQDHIMVVVYSGG